MGNRQSKPSPGSPAKTISSPPRSKSPTPDYISELPTHLQGQQSLLRNIEESLLILFLRASWANLQLSCSFAPNFLREVGCNIGKKRAPVKIGCEKIEVFFF
ncbi:hypothetical protein CEXT_293851 [Caerostris extrusa]|uniref:Uncharacterized protein n=1 Tax=Caerostris extrusa TaxID=172846 RepID=A0AAV4XHF5_CAEEX|nr:hypothetical protein CEXT_293851 [Caerostris extrusa]